jgi:RNA polymerase sigma-70 factor (ECF subfamily)
MDDAFHSLTSSTLLGRLRGAPADQAAWREFVERYGPKIYGWCRKWRLQQADAEDVTQNVLVRLASRLRTFVYDPDQSFRGWLKTVTWHALSDYLSARQRPGQGSGDPDVARELESIAARDDLMQQLAADFDHELLEEAQARVQARVGPGRWQAFCLTAYEGLSGAEVARRLDMNVITVFTAKSKVLKMLQKEIRKLEGPDSARELRCNPVLPRTSSRSFWPSG